MFSEFKFEKYINNGIENIIRNTLKSTLKNPKESLFLAKFVLAYREAVAIRESYHKNGRNIPPFLVCNLTDNSIHHCMNFYEKANSFLPDYIFTDRLRIINRKQLFHNASEFGISFILISCSEPQDSIDILKTAANNKKIIFPVFIDRTLSDEVFTLFDKNRNLLPIIKTEADHLQNASKIDEGMKKIRLTVTRLISSGIFFGISITFTKGNLNYVLSDTLLSDLYYKGCKVIFLLEYVPADTCTDISLLTIREKEILNQKLRFLRLQYEDMIIIYFP